VNLRKIGAVLALSILLAPAHAQTEIQWWHSMTGANNTGVNELATRFNASQKEYKIVPVFKGSYPESMTAAIAAFRAGNPPHILQVFEVGTATMMGAKGAIKPVHEMMKEAGEKFDPHRHQAMTMVESAQPPNTVANVFQKGYLLNGRLLRPALVVVARHDD